MSIEVPIILTIIAIIIFYTTFWVVKKYNQILKLKNKSEVVTLLGNPSNSTSDNQWVYDLGISSAGFGVQFNNLQITFKNNVVAKVKKFVITD